MMTTSGNPPKHRILAQDGRSPSPQQTSAGSKPGAKRGRSPRTYGANKMVRHHAKRGRLSKENTIIETPMSSLSLCPPPVIHPFSDQEASIEWGERLDADMISGSDSERKTFFFKVKIYSKPYVLKVFKFIDPLTKIWNWRDRLGEEYPLEKAIVYTDPFYAECRAYGRIQEAMDKGEISGKIATKCHGYTFLNADTQRWLEDQGIYLGTERLNDELLPIVGGAGRPRAIVKDFEIAGPALSNQTPQQIRNSFRNVRQLNTLGIYNRDVRAENFRNGWLIDFDLSYTLPHDIYNVFPPFEAEETQAGDVAMFDDILDEAGVNLRFLANKDFNLRPRLKRIQYEGL
ncbi:kinetochore Sim4 complex subunit FTA2-domain-containing protein [Xylaria sp. FL0933]|nr:kinetochore Sim4 complex subunit FTA2-domain-containing protein [Xylaria sp. FL0933]